MFDPLAVPTSVRSKLIFALLLGLGIGGFLFLCVSASTCGACYISPCVYPDGMEELYTVNASLCFSGATTGLFFCFLSGWGATLTIRRKSSVMGFGHFFGATCVAFLMAAQSAGMWGSEATLIQAFADHPVDMTYFVRDSPGIEQYSRVTENEPLHRACSFLFTVSVVVSLVLMVLAPTYFVSRDVYDRDAEKPSSLNSATRRSSSSYSGGRPFTISNYEPGADDERQYLGRASIPMRNIRPQYRQIPEQDDPTVNLAVIEGV